MYGKIVDAGRGPYHLQVRRDLAVVPCGETLAARWLHESQSSVNQVGVCTPCRVVQTRDRSILVCEWLGL